MEDSVVQLLYPKDNEEGGQMADVPCGVVSIQLCL